MKVFFTPAIDGIYRPLLQRRLEDKPDNEAYEVVERMTGETGLDQLASQGFTKVLSRDAAGDIDGYWTYQQDDL